MDIQAYISSGILELYVLDQLSAKEREEVEKNRLSHAEIGAEIERIEIFLEKFAFDYGKQPKASLKDKIMESIAEIEQKNKKSAQVVSLRAAWRYRLSVAAAVLLFATSGILGYGLWQQKVTQADLIAAKEQQVVQIERELAIAKNPDYRHIVLNSTDSTKQQAALVLWNPKSQEVYFEMSQLPALPADKQYQLWAIIDGNPTDMGVSETTTKLQKMKVAQNVQAFAVTIEPKGGSIKPTLTAMVVVGKV